MTIVTVNYCKFITNYYENLLQVTSTLPQITAKCYYKLQQKILQITAHLFLQNSKLLQITSKFYYKLKQLLVLLQITANSSMVILNGDVLNTSYY